MQILERKYPTQPARPKYPEKREHEYIRHGTRALIASFVVPTGEVVWDLGQTRTSVDFANHLRHVAERFQKWERITWVVDNLNTHWSLEACQVLSTLNRLKFEPQKLQSGELRRIFLTNPQHHYRFVFTPTHGSWLLHMTFLKTQRHTGIQNEGGQECWFVFKDMAQDNFPKWSKLGRVSG